MEVFLILITEKNIILLLVEHGAQRVWFLKYCLMLLLLSMVVWENILCIVSVATHDEVMLGLVVEEEVMGRGHRTTIQAITYIQLNAILLDVLH